MRAVRSGAGGRGADRRRRRRPRRRAGGGPRLRRRRRRQPDRHRVAGPRRRASAAVDPRDGCRRDDRVGRPGGRGICAGRSGDGRHDAPPAGGRCSSRAHRRARGSVVPIPDGATLAEAATLPMNGLTARLGIELLGLPAGATLAISGGAGCLSSYAIRSPENRDISVAEMLQFSVYEARARADRCVWSAVRARAARAERHGGVRCDAAVHRARQRRAGLRHRPRVAATGDLAERFRTDDPDRERRLSRRAHLPRRQAGDRLPRPHSIRRSELRASHRALERLDAPEHEHLQPVDSVKRLRLSDDP